MMSLPHFQGNTHIKIFTKSKNFYVNLYNNINEIKEFYVDYIKIVNNINNDGTILIKFIIEENLINNICNNLLNKINFIEYAIVKTNDISENLLYKIFKVKLKSYSLENNINSEDLMFIGVEFTIEEEHDSDNIKMIVRNSKINDII